MHDINYTTFLRKTDPRKYPKTLKNMWFCNFFTYWKIFLLCFDLNQNQTRIVSSIKHMQRHSYITGNINVVMRTIISAVQQSGYKSNLSFTRSYTCTMKRLQQQPYNWKRLHQLKFMILVAWINSSKYIPWWLFKMYISLVFDYCYLRIYHKSLE